MAEYDIRFARGFSLNEALAMLDNDVDLVKNIDSLTIFPPENACGNQTQEDSGEENLVNLNNLPLTQLQAPVEIDLHHADNGSQLCDDEFSSEDEIPLSLLNKR
ncbi:dihydrolipoyllysine-residue succinyltransferase [Holotrichia oblita]|uniref:Dihydrolipoyllysine-residue succinyltransferase n=1 Tax=Holotrichia oblita TaxID=644536 RepID=A0ACB9TQI7_HOLOL|nr:dihydrolipoyllysine-residue succinyltransferase [Holotrichia oblita]